MRVISESNWLHSACIVVISGKLGSCSTVELMTQETPWWDSNPQITVLQTAALTISPHEEKKQRVVTPKVIVFASLSSVSVCYQQALIDLLRHHSLMDGHFQAYQLFLCFVISTGLEPVTSTLVCHTCFYTGKLNVFIKLSSIISVKCKGWTLYL